MFMRQKNGRLTYTSYTTNCKVLEQLRGGKSSGGKSERHLYD